MIAEHGATTWGNAWLRTVEPIRITRPNPSLPRARNLARGEVTELIAHPGLVTATAAGQRVRIEFPLWPAESLALVAELLAGSTDTPLPSGDLPDTLADALHRNGIGLAPAVDELAQHCGCRDRREQCLHVLATLYSLVQAVDERPALALELRGVTSTAPADPDWLPLHEIPVAGFYG